MGIDRIISIATLFSVVFGLGLVIWELQQARILSRAQLSSDMVDSMNAVYQIPVGENLSTALEKACLNPDDLELSETIEIDRYYLALANLIARMHLLSERDGLYPKGYWKGTLSFLTPVFSSEYGKKWFNDRSTLDYFDSNKDLIEAGMEYMATFEGNRCEQQYLRRTSNEGQQRNINRQG